MCRYVAAVCRNTSRLHLDCDTRACTHTHTGMLLEVSGVRLCVYISSRQTGQETDRRTDSSRPSKSNTSTTASTNRMLCPSVFQPAPVSMRPFLDLRWPVRSLWPEVQPLFFHMEQEMIRHIQEMRQSMEHMERLHQRIFQEIDHNTSLTGGFKPIAFQQLEGSGNSFALSLDTQHFSPQELSVKQVGRKLRVSGRTEKKKEDDHGSFSYSCQEFRQELSLPEDIDPEAVTCSLVGGRLQIQAPRERAAQDGKERVIPISLPSAPAVSASPAQPAEGNSSTEKSAEEKQ